MQRHGGPLLLVAAAALIVPLAIAPVFHAQTPSDELAQGERLFAQRCAVCHGPAGEGGKGPSLAQPHLLRAPDREALIGVIRRGIDGTEMPGSRMADTELQQLATFVLRLGQRPAAVVPGDAGHGAQLFAGKGGCGACHAINGQGGAFGPDLTEIGRRRGPGYLRRSLVEPDADLPKSFSVYRSDSSITENFLQVRVTTRDGQQMLGVRVNEDSFSIQLRDVSGRIHSFVKSELRELHKDWGRSPMPAYGAVFSSTELDDVVAFLASLGGGSVKITPASASVISVTSDRLVHAEREPANWLTYSGNYQGQRFSPLAQITRDNVSRLTLAWVYQSRDAGKLEASPIVVDNIVYITEQPHVVSALDGRTGRPLWSYRRPAAQNVPGCCGQINRGVAILGDTIYTATFDGHLLAIDANSGKLRWDVPVLAPGTSASVSAGDGHSMSAAPLIVKDKVIVGIAGGEFGIRGFLDAYDARTGARVWRLWTVPAPGEPGHDTWKGAPDAWTHGGAATWLTGSYDPDLNVIYWGTGNPGPNYNGDDRAGDNLYTNSLLAIDADTGRLRWHFQFTPHDLHDWDSNQIPVLVDATLNGRPRKLVVQGNRNAFYYVLDRETGEFLSGTPYTRQTWADGLDPRGRPIVNADTTPTPEGNLVYPGLAGGTNWFSPSYSPLTRLFYLGVYDDYAQTFFKLKMPYEPGANFEGGSARNVEGVEHRGVVKALDALTGATRWTFDMFAAPSAGLLSTAGGLLFTGNREGHFFALDANTGELVWRFQTGGAIGANPVSFAIDGRQHVAIVSGHAIFVFALPR